LEGRTQDEAAAELGWSKRTLRRRLKEGRMGLGRRLSRRGVVWPAALSAVLFSDAGVSAVLSPGLLDSTVKAASLFAAGQTAAAGLISAKAAALTEGVLQTMLLSKLKVAVVITLAICALGIGASALRHGTVAAEPPSAVSKSAIPGQDQDNLKETVLAVEKRTWEAYAKQDVAAFKNLVADDFVCIDTFGRPSDKAGVLDYVARFRVLEHTMKDVKVVLLNATSAIVSYEVQYKVRPTAGQRVENTTRRITSAWAQRKGRWWYVYCEDRIVQTDLPFFKLQHFDVEDGPIDTIRPEAKREKGPPQD
jgi:hypothetical protein